MDPIQDGMLERESRFVRAIARAMVGSGDAADLEQDAWLRAIENGAYGVRRPRAWLAAIVRSVAFGKMRSDAARVRRERRAARPELEVGDSELVEKAALARELLDEVLALEEPGRSTLLRRFYLDVAVSEIAAKDGVPVATVRSRLHRALEKLRARLERRGRDWRAAFLLFCGQGRSELPAAGTTALKMGVLLMGVKTGASLAAAAVLVVIGVLVMKGAGLEDAGLGSGGRGGGSDEARRSTALASAEGPTESVASAPAAALPNLGPIDREVDLHGVVVDESGAPIAGATVSLLRASIRGRNELEVGEATKPVLVSRGASGADGAFRFRLRPGDSYDLAAEAPNRAAERLMDRYAGEFVRIVLDRGARVFGRVLRERDKAPLAGARVTISRWMPDDRSKLGEAVADSSGRFEIRGVGRGRAVIEAAIEGFPWDYGVAIDSRSGAEIEVDLVLSEGSTVVGRIVNDADGEPIAGALVSSSWTIDDAVKTDASGNYVLTTIPKGRTQPSIYATAAGFGRTSVTAAIDADGRVRADLRLRKAHSVRGSVVDADGRPIRQAHVAAFAYSLAVPGGRLDWQTAKTNEAGEFQIDGLFDEARHAVLVRAEGFGDRVYDLPFAELETPVYDMGAVRLLPGGTIRGVVLDDAGKPVARGYIVMRGCNHDRFRLNGSEAATSVDAFDYGQRRSCLTDDLGRFTFTDLAASVYRFDTSRIAGRRKDEELAVTLGEGESVKDIRIELIRDVLGTFLGGQAVDEEGKPVAFATVSYRSLDPNGGWNGYDHTGADGRFCFTGIPAGKYALEATTLFAGWSLGKPRYFQGSVESATTGTKDIRLIVPRAQAISGVVCDRKDRPNPWATIVAVDHETGQSVMTVSDVDGTFTIWVRAESVVKLSVTPSRFWDAAGAGGAGSLDAPPRQTELIGICAGAENLRVEVKSR